MWCAQCCARWSLDTTMSTRPPSFSQVAPFYWNLFKFRFLSFFCSFIDEIHIDTWREKEKQWLQQVISAQVFQLIFLHSILVH